VDFAWLVAAAYSGFVIYDSGPSGSIPLSQASPGNALNIVEKVTGHILPYGQSIFTTLNIVPTLIVLLVMPFVLMRMRPAEHDTQVFVPPVETPPKAVARSQLLARRIEHSPLGSLFLVAAGIAY